MSSAFSAPTGDKETAKTAAQAAALELPNSILPVLSDDVWGPNKYGATIQIDRPPEETICAGDNGNIAAIDVETDERDNFVGAAVCSGPSVSYVTKIEHVKTYVEKCPQLVGHNIKGDIHWLKKWGVNVSDKNIWFDTMVASYVVNPIKQSHGLKPLAAELLGMKWPSYAEMVGKGKKRITLNNQPVERVARYCGMDCLATWRLYQYFQRKFTPNQRRIFSQLEMPVNRLLYRIEDTGVTINTKLLDELGVEFSEGIKAILEKIQTLTEKDIEQLLLNYKLEQLKEKWEQSGYKAFEKNRRFNPGSWQQKRLLLKYMGLAVASTDKKQLIKLRGNKLIDLLLGHSELAKLFNAFISAFRELPSLPLIHPTFSQVSEAAGDEDDMHGIRTGRLSCKQPNLQQIPARTENGKKLRKLFVPRDGYTFIVADYSQIELRLAAHFSHDPILCKAFMDGEDVHEATARALGVDRFFGKTGNFLLAFGGSHYRLMDALNIDEQKAKDFYWSYWRKFVVLRSWERRAVMAAREKGGITTIMGRWIPVEGLRSDDLKIKGKAERRAISCIIQGSAADVIKLAMLECDKAGYTPLLTIHDELIFEVDKNIEPGGTFMQFVVAKLKWLMESVVKLDVPLEVVIGHGLNWGEAKH